jgi:hypothetical protein
MGAASTLLQATSRGADSKFERDTCHVAHAATFERLLVRISKDRKDRSGLALVPAPSWPVFVIEELVGSQPRLHKPSLFGESDRARRADRGYPLVA